MLLCGTARRYMYEMGDRIQPRKGGVFAQLNKNTSSSLRSKTLAVMRILVGNAGESVTRRQKKGKRESISFLLRTKKL